MGANQAMVNLSAKLGETQAETEVKFVTSPEVLGAILQREFTLSDDENMDLGTLAEVLESTCSESIDGKTQRGAMILATQAEALNSIFTRLAVKAARNMNGYVEATNVYLRLALKAQSQSRATIEALGRLQNPKITQFVGQLNATTGPQQVNNATGEAIENQPNELLDLENAKWMDRGAKSQAVENDPKVETLGARHRA